MNNLVKEKEQFSAYQIEFLSRLGVRVEKHSELTQIVFNDAADSAELRLLYLDTALRKLIRK